MHGHSLSHVLPVISFRRYAPTDFAIIVVMAPPDNCLRGSA
jgi:hypothetical protein